MEILAKLTDAGSMFWQSLSEQERRLVVYFALYLLVSTLAALHSSSRERLKRELREELQRGAEAA